MSKKKIKENKKQIPKPGKDSGKSNILHSKYFPLVIITALFLFTYPNTFDKKLANLGDNASYYMLGKSIASGEGYVNLSSISKSPHNHYPPGYPLIISVVLLMNDSILLVKLVNGLFLLASLIIFFKIFEIITQSRNIALVGVVFLALNSHLLYYSTIIMSEIPYMLFSGIALWAFLNLKKEEPWFKSKWFYLSLIAVVFSFYIRSAGIALIGGIAIFLLLMKNWKYLMAYIIGFVLLILPWVIRGQHLGGSSYMKQLAMINPYRPELGTADFGDLISRMTSNIARYISKEIPSVTIPVFEVNYREASAFGDYLIGFIILGLTIYGLLNLKRHKWLFVFYLMVTAGLLSIWPSPWVGIRFILPVVPLIVIPALLGIKLLIDRVFKVNFLLLGLLVLFFIPSISKLSRNSKTPYTANWQNYYQIATWLKNNEQEKVIVSCGKPMLFYVYSNHFTYRYKFTSDDQELIRDLFDRNVKYVVLDQVYGNSARYLFPAIQNNQDNFRLVLKLENPDTYLLELVK